MSNDMRTLADVQPGGRVRVDKEPRAHRWDDVGERCLDCGDKDWMGGACSGPRAAVASVPVALSRAGQEEARAEGLLATLVKIRDSTFRDAAALRGIADMAINSDRARDFQLAGRRPVGQEPFGWWMQDSNGVGYFTRTMQPAALFAYSSTPGNSATPLHTAPPALVVKLGSGIAAIADERLRQLQAEGFTRENDQQYRRGELAKAATAYAQLAAMDLEAGTRDHIAWHGPAGAWPWAREWWKPVDARRDLVRAGALIAAQIDLIDSTAARNG
ncbi:TPA: hypothetical protein ACOEOA_000282 [Stenotrophomonas maltophilia]